ERVYLKTVIAVVVQTVRALRPRHREHQVRPLFLAQLALTELSLYDVACDLLDVVVFEHPQGYFFLAPALKGRRRGTRHPFPLSPVVVALHLDLSNGLVEPVPIVHVLRCAGVACKSHLSLPIVSDMSSAGKGTITNSLFSRTSAVWLSATSSNEQGWPSTFRAVILSTTFLTGVFSSILWTMTGYVRFGWSPME